MISTEIPRAIERHLKTVAFFTAPVPIPVIPLCERDLISMVRQNMETLGICATVQVTGFGDPPNNQSPGCIRFDNITIAINIREVLEINRTGQLGTGIACETVAEAIMANLSGATLSTETGNRIAVSPLMVTSASITEDEDPSVLAWVVYFKTSALLKADDMSQSNQQEPSQNSTLI